MNETHYKEKLSEFVNHELPQDQRQSVAEHLLQCADCRSEHDQIKLGAALASRLKQRDAPENLWNKIANNLDEEEKSRVSSIPTFAFFGPRSILAAAGLLIVFGLFAVIYLGVFKTAAPEIAKNEAPANVAVSQVTLAPDEIIANRKTTAANQTAETDSLIQAPAEENLPVKAQPPIKDSNVETLPKIKREEPIVAQKDPASWNVETLAGVPKVGNSADGGKLSVGEFLETDANSRARVQVADIGNVEIAPNSRIKLVGTTSTEHRLSLERGQMHAKIYAPPRLFIVDTPSAVAVDLGCEYTLEVDDDGNSKLHVTGGFVALENGKRQSIVPAGAIALTRKGKGIGTPFAEDASIDFQAALYEFDFAGGGQESLQTIIEEAGVYDSLTLWHLLSRVERAEREQVFDALSTHVKPPAGVTREGILNLDKKMLDDWWTEVENAWFG